MRCFRRLLGISYKDKITNIEVKERIRNSIGKYEELLCTIKRRKLKWYGHVSRSNGLAKTILQGIDPGGRRRGGQRKKWEDNISEWTGRSIGRCTRECEDREVWRETISRSCAVPLQTQQLRDM